jgi:hypothetical protein
LDKREQDEQEKWFKFLMDKKREREAKLAEEED